MIKNKIDLSITIPTYNEEKDLPKCLSKIVDQDYPKDKFEVIIVDNNSTDDTLKIIEKFSRLINIRLLKSNIKDAEVSKMIGFKSARGKFFMYLDADMQFSDRKFIKRMLHPLKKNHEIAGVFIRFLVNKKHPPLTRTLSYDEWQRDPIFKFFTPSVKKIIKEKREGYFLCICDRKNIPPQGLMIYRRDIIEPYAFTQTQLIDNEIPAVMVEIGRNKFAFVPNTGVYHLLLRNLYELAHKRTRNLKRTYYPNKSSRLYRWVDWKKDWSKAIMWVIYTHSFIPIFPAIIKSIKHRDPCFFNEPLINLVSTYSIIWGVISGIKNNGKKT